MSIRRMMLFTLGAKIKNLIDAFKTRVLATQGEFEAESCLEAQLTELDNDNLLDNASLVVTPNGYKENLLYSVVSNTTIGDMSVTRATTATRVNADGFIEEVPYNLLSQSENFENVSWLKQRTTIGQNVILAPNGTLTGDNLIANSGVTYEYIGASGVNIMNLTSFATFVGTRTASVYLKYNGLDRIRFQYGVSSALIFNLYVEVDLQTGLITGTRLNNGGADFISNPFIENVGNGWYRVGFSMTTASPTNLRLAVALGDTTKTIANGVDGVYIWGFQMVDGNQAKDYFPTTNRFNIPRIDYSNGSCPSILVEPQRTNLVFPSQTLTTQTRTVTAVAHTLSFYGTGSITLSGVAIGVLNGTGVNNRVTLTFTPTAGSLILTVIGSVTLAQLEAGPNVTSYIPTVASTATRNADVITNTNASTLIGQTDGSVYFEIYFNVITNAGFRAFFSLEGDIVNQFSAFNVATTLNGNNINYAGTNFNLTEGVHKIVCSYSQATNTRKLYVDGVLIATSTHTNFLSTITRLSLGSRINPFSGFATDRQQNGSFKSFLLYKEQLTDAQAIQLTTL
jgi:hypothetical protein